MATTSLSGILNVMYCVQFGSLAATISATCGGLGNFLFWGGGCGGARLAGIIVVAFPEIAKAAYTVFPSWLTASARGLPPNTGTVLIRACVLVSKTAIVLLREQLT